MGATRMVVPGERRVHLTIRCSLSSVSTCCSSGDDDLTVQTSSVIEIVEDS
jgi:hypothetical protein